MAKSDRIIRMGKFTYTQTELDQMFEEADRRGRERLEREPLAVKVDYDVAVRQIVITLNNGSRYAFPADIAQGLASATDRQRAKVNILGMGTLLEWPLIDMHFTTLGLLEGRFGTRRWIDELRRTGKLPPPPPPSPNAVKPKRKTTVKRTTPPIRKTSAPKKTVAKSVRSSASRVAAAGH